jgi:HTH-type transcriptional regulator / antitoxin HigA
MLKTKRRTSSGKGSSDKVRGVKIQTNLKKQLLTKNRKKEIKSKEAYELTMKEVDALMKRGESNLNKRELARLRSLAIAAERYEDTHDPLPLPESLPDMIKMRMFQMRLNQSFAAKLLGVSDAKFSLILSGRQKPDVYFLKAIHDKLRVDANKILQAL